MYLKKCVNDFGMRECDVKEMSDSTVLWIAGKLRADDTFNIFSKVSNKNETRYTAENSERSTIAYTKAVEAVHIFPATRNEDFHVPYEHMTDDRKLMFNLVKSQHAPGTSLVHVLPELVTTTDELTAFATIVKVKDKEDYYITIKPEPGKRLPASNT